MIGIHLQLFNGTTPLVNLSGIQAMWWDVTEPKDGSKPDGKTITASTDSNGYINLDLSNVTDLGIGDYGFLMIYQPNAGNHEDSLVFAGKVQTADILTGADMYFYESGWTRVSDWPLIAAPIAGVEKFQGIYAVYDIETAGNGVALYCEGAYHVDWGDGTSEDVPTATIAEHVYDYDNAILGVACCRHYKCAVVTVTPQVGEHLTNLDLNKRHSNYSSVCIAPWLDISINSEYLTQLTISDNAQLVRMSMLEQVQLGENTVQDFTYLFRSCYTLKSLPVFNTSSAVIIAYMFYSCYSLADLPIFDTANVVDMQYAFYVCFSLERVPPLNTSNVENMNGTFRDCHTIRKLPLLDTSKVTTMSWTMAYCYALLKSPQFNTSAVLNMSNLFYNSYSLKQIPLLDTSKVTTALAMFRACYSLEYVPDLDFSSLLDSKEMFYYCLSLTEAPAINMALVTGSLNMFLYCYSLKRSKVYQTGVTISYINCCLGPDALNEIYENLKTGVTATITVTGNWGVSSDDPTKAPAGWTVTG